ncbi:DMT family transporter [Roseivivax sediminis]|nr:DMT family transporter [Roseivivax sediminis]
MTQATDIPPRAWSLLVALALIWGASFLAIRTALDEIAPLASVLYRTGPAALALWLWVAVRRLPVTRDPRLWVAFLGMGILNNAIPFSLMAWGQLHIPTGLTSILNAATAIWGVLVAALVFSDERLSPRKAAGTLIGFAGVATAIGWRALVALDVTSLAQLAVLGGTLSYAVAGAWGRRFLRGLTPEVAAAGMLTAATLVMLPVTLAVEGMPPAHLGLRTLAAIGYYALVATSCAYLLYYRILALTGSGTLLLVTLMIPPVAITLGALVRGETLSSSAFGGFALLALGLALIDGRLLRRRDARSV